jgi:hypothetical protein
VVGVTTIGVTSLAIVSFLGRYVGTFTVSLTSNEVKLALSEKKSYETQTSFLRISDLKAFEETTFKVVHDTNPDDETLDYTFGANLNPKTGKVETFEFFKYTFYVKNVGTTTATYNLKIKNLESVAAKDGSGRKLDDTLRVMIYENDPDSDMHDYKVYAKAAAEKNYTRDGEPTYKEFVSSYPYDNTESDEYPLVDDTFIDDRTIASYFVSDFQSEQIKRYTVVTWLEGEDPQSSNEYKSPIGATIKLGVEITAYEN